MHACMHACVHACIHTYIHTYIHTHLPIHVHIHTYTYIHTHTHTYTYTHTYTSTYTYTYTHTGWGTEADPIRARPRFKPCDNPTVAATALLATCAFTSNTMYIYIYTYMYKCINTYIYIYIYMCLYVFICVYNCSGRRGSAWRRWPCCPWRRPRAPASGGVQKRTVLLTRNGPLRVVIYPRSSPK